MLEYYIHSDLAINQVLHQSRYFHIPAGNLPADATSFGSDVFFARSDPVHVLYVPQLTVNLQKPHPTKPRLMVFIK